MLPPENLLAHQKALQEHAERLSRAQASTDVEIRRMVLAHAWLLCTCRPWYEHSEIAPQAGCIVHSQMTWTGTGWI